MKIFKIINMILLLALIYSCGSSGYNYNRSYNTNQQNINLKNAKSYYAKKDYKNAIKYYEQYLKQNPNDWLSTNHLAWSYFFTKQYRKAEITFEKSIALDKNITPAYGNYQGLGRSLYFLGKYKESIASFKKYKSLMPSHVEPIYWIAWNNLHLKQYDDAIKGFKLTLSLDKKNIFTADSYQGLGRAYYAKGEYDKSITYWSKSLEFKQNNHIAYNFIGWSYYYKKDYDKAIDYFIKSNNIKELSSNFYGLGLSELEKKSYYQAEKFLLKAYDMYKDFNVKNNIKVNLGQIYLQEEKYKKASEILTRYPYFGLNLANDYFGVKVVGVVKNSSAYFSGFKEGDILININEIPLKGMKVNEVINNVIKILPVYSWVDVKIIRQGKVKNKKIFVGVTADLPKKYNANKTIVNNADEIKRPVKYKNNDSVHREKWALIIGISDYKDNRIESLRYASQDAKALYEWLISNNGGRYSPSRVKLLVNEKATFKNIRNALFTWLKQPLKEDMVTIFYAGHGSSDSPDTPENLYLLPYDTDYENIATTGFPMWDFETALKRFIIADQVVIIADACHSGGIGGDFDRQRRGVRALKANKINSGLERLTDSGKGIAILSSASDNQLAQESSKWGGGHGVFTYYLLKGLKGDADYNGDNQVTMGELIPYVSEKVRRSTYNSQSPTISGKFDPALSISK